MANVYNNEKEQQQKIIWEQLGVFKTVERIKNKNKNKKKIKQETETQGKIFKKLKPQKKAKFSSLTNCSWYLLPLKCKLPSTVHQHTTHTHTHTRKEAKKLTFIIKKKATLRHFKKQPKKKK